MASFVKNIHIIILDEFNSLKLMNQILFVIWNLQKKKYWNAIKKNINWIYLRQSVEIGSKKFDIKNNFNF